MSIRGLQAFRIGRHGVQVGKKFLSQFVNLLFDIILFETVGCKFKATLDRKQVGHVPFLLQLELQLQTFNLYFALFLMLQDGSIRFPVLRRGYIPRTSTVGCGLVDAQGRQVAYDVTIGTTIERSSAQEETRHQLF